MALHENKVELLRKIDIFSSLREYELDSLARYSEFKDYKKGEAIFTQDSPAEELFVLERGRIGIISLASKDDVTIARIAPGESFGELDYLGRAGRSAAAFAEEDSVLLVFPAAGYGSQGIFKDHPYISAHMLFRLFGVLAERIWRVNALLYEKSNWIHDLHKQVLCDKMTGLYNRTYLEEDYIHLLPDPGSHAALLMIKPDNFKEINDRYGHEAGDQVLNIMAIFLQSELGEHDIGIRYRGDEYAAILMDTDRDGAVRRAKEIGAAFDSMDISGIIGPGNLRIKVSIGIALYPDHSGTSGGLVEIAHKKMLNARDGGGNRIII
jgi:diguanylate cyclase